MVVEASVHEAWPAAGVSKTELARRMGRSEGEGEMDQDDVAVTALFQRLGLAPDRVEHPPVHTVEEARPHWSALAGAHTKNLFLKDKDALFLVTLGAETRVDMKALAPLLGTKRLSFASADRLMQHLGTAPGAVSPLSLVKDEARAVRFAIERALWEAPRVTCHSLRNRVADRRGTPGDPGRSRGRADPPRPLTPPTAGVGVCEYGSPVPGREHPALSPRSRTAATMRANASRRCSESRPGMRRHPHGGVRPAWHSTTGLANA